MREKRLYVIMLAIVLMSRKTGVSVTEMMDELEMTRDAVLRLKKTMEYMGIPIYYDLRPGDKKRYWRINDKDLKRLPRILLTDVELNLVEVRALNLMVNNQGMDSETTTVAKQALGKMIKMFPVESQTKILWMPRKAEVGEQGEDDWHETPGLAA